MAPNYGIANYKGLAFKSTDADKFHINEETL